METKLLIPLKKNRPVSSIDEPENKVKAKPIKGIEKFFVQLAKQFALLYYAAIIIKKPAEILRVKKHLMEMLRQTWGGTKNKTYKVNGKYYYNIYVPAWPSENYNAFVKDEIKRQAFPLHYRGNVSSVFLAMTTKCPLRCEHCFEWENLNKKETFSKEELQEIINMYQREGAVQIHFTGGEPLVRMNDLVELINYAKNKSECFVLTSGFNLTRENAKRLKNAGCTGVSISIDHYIPKLHNAFRHHPNIFQQAVNGVQAALQAGLVTTISVCTTRSFIENGHLMPYTEFAKELGVHFVQLLEPKNIGHYANKDVLLEEKHIKQLEKIFETINQDEKCKDYPFIMYHGYHQRRCGCFSGIHSIYIDSAGFANTCPFCHTKSYNVAHILKTEEKKVPSKEQICPAFIKLA